jgi:hypothetical protein
MESKPGSERDLPDRQERAADLLSWKDRPERPAYLLSWKESIIQVPWFIAAAFFIVLGIAWVLSIMALFFASGAVLVVQCKWWLRDGVWTPLRVGVLLSRASVDASRLSPHWHGVQKIINWLCDFPLSAGLFFFALLTGSLFVFSLKKLEKVGPSSPEDKNLFSS